MARFRRSMALRPINRIKHVVDGNGTLASATVLPEDLITTSDVPTIANTKGVETGSKVNGIYLKVEVASNETVAGAVPNVYMAVYKNPGSVLAQIDPQTVGDDVNKRFVIHQEMIMLNNLKGGNPRVLFNGVIAIPKGYRRFGPDDKLKMSLKAGTTDIVFCYQAHFKEFR